MALDVPAIVATADGARSLASLGASAGAVRAWEGATGFAAIDLPEEPAKKNPPVDPTRAARLLRVETILHDARVPLDLGDVSTLANVRASVAMAYDEARTHPADPEAPWLVAEALRTLARIEELAGDAEGGKALRARASVLDSGRLIGISEGASGTTAATASTPVVLQLTLSGAPAGARVRVDGLLRGPGELASLALAPGEHHLRVAGQTDAGLDGPTLYGGWFVVNESKTQTLAIRVGEGAIACSRADLAPALTALVDRVDATFQVTCPRWARLQPSKAGLVIVRLCGARSCAPSTTWLGAAAATQTPPATPSTSIWKSGWTYAAIGAAAVVVSGVTAWRLGAFDRPEAPPPTWRWEGAK